MKVFISWSGMGHLSHTAASALHDWLPEVLQVVQPWMSSESIEAGQRWANEIAQHLDACEFGIICVTHESMASAWLNFEAGALSKHLEGKSRVVPYLVGLEPGAMKGPLTQFQAHVADRDGTLRLVKSLNNALKVPLSDSRVDNAFNKNWPDLESRLTRGISATPAPPPRDKEEVLQEILETVRGISRATGELPASIAEVVYRDAHRRELAARMATRVARLRDVVDGMERQKGEEIIPAEDAADDPVEP